MKRILFLCMFGLLLSGQQAPAAAPAVFRAGAATNNITSELGSNIVGGFGPQLAKHIHDDQFARCIVLDDGKTKIALVVCDILGLSDKLCTAARERIQEQTGIPAGNVLICATHTHSAASALAANRYNLNADLTDYQKFIVRRIADGVQSAHNNLRPAEFAFGTVAIPEHVFNRRWYLKPGTMPANPFGKTDEKVKMNPGVGNANLVKPAGPTDPEVSILSFRDLDGNPIAVLASYSLHYVGGVPNGHISADYFGMFSKHLYELVGRKDLDPPFVPILANGTSGDINNVNFKEGRPAKKPYEQMRYVAHDVAEKVYQKLQDLQYDSKITLGATHREIPMNLRQPDEEMVGWMEKTIAAGPQRPVDLSFIYAERIRAITQQPKEWSAFLQVLRIGNLCIGTMPCEVFVEIGLDFKKNSPIKPALLMSLSQGYTGYLPPPHQHELGGYETWLGTNRLEKNASDIMLQNLFEMTKDVQPGAGKQASAEKK